jgi:hypothetical protein
MGYGQDQWWRGCLGFRWGWNRECEFRWKFEDLTCGPVGVATRGTAGVRFRELLVGEAHGGLVPMS